MDRQQQIQTKDSRPKSLGSYIAIGIGLGLGQLPAYPRIAVESFFHTKDVHPFLLKNGIKMRSILDYYTYFKNRDGTYRIWNCFFSGVIWLEVESVGNQIKEYYLNEVFKFRDPARPNSSTEKLEKI